MNLELIQQRYRQLVPKRKPSDLIDYSNVIESGALYLRIIEINKQIEKLKQQEIQYEKRMLELEYKSYVY